METNSTTSQALFALGWKSLVELLGSATAAALVRHAAARGAAAAPVLGELRVELEKLEYRCIVPGSWKTPPPSDDLRVLFRELRSLLDALTGPVVVNRLRAIPELQAAHLLEREDQAR